MLAASANAIYRLISISMKVLMSNPAMMTNTVLFIDGLAMPVNEQISLQTATGGINPTITAAAIIDAPIA